MSQKRRLLRSVNGILDLGKKKLEEGLGYTEI